VSDLLCIDAQIFFGFLVCYVLYGQTFVTEKFLMEQGLRKCALELAWRQEGDSCWRSRLRYAQ
jgi:hypothetical protein